MRIKFKEEFHSYKIMIQDENFIIATKPFNAKKTFFYVIVDIKDKVRGKDNYIFGKFDYSDPKDCYQALAELNSGVLGVSGRNRVKLNIEWIRAK